MNKKRLSRLRLGLFGGGFDPVHLGHLLLAETARQEAALDRVVFVPTGRSPHRCGKDCYHAEAEHRFQMLRLATADCPEFEVGRHEIDRQETSYTIDTLRTLHAERPNADFFLILGGDIFHDLPQWRNVDEILKLATPLVALRPGFTEMFASSIRYLPLPMPQLEISSTGIRRDRAAGKSIRFRVPATVEAYMRDHQLYAENEKNSPKPS